MDILKPIDSLIGLIREVVPDSDKQAEITAQLEQLREKVYMKELDTKTIPWVDALHKMGRQILAVASMAVGSYLLYKHPDINPATMAAVMGPGGIYNWMKGRGK